MSGLLKLFLALPGSWQAGILALLVAGAAGSVYAAWHAVDGAGYERGKAESDLSWQSKWDAREAAILRSRMDEATRQARANVDARAKEADDVARIATLEGQLSTLSGQLDTEAADDPQHNAPALDAAAVARYNRLVATGRPQ